MTPTSPPIFSASSLQMARPRPVPRSAVSLKSLLGKLQEQQVELVPGDADTRVSDLEAQVRVLRSR